MDRERTGPRRDPYAKVGAMTRDVIGRALELQAPPRALRVLLAIVSETTSWSRIEAVVTRKRIADVTGMSEREIHRAIAWLHGNGIIGWQPGYSLPGGPRVASRVSLTGGPTDHLSEGQQVVSQGHDRWSGRVTTGGLGCPTNEDSTRSPRGASSGGRPEGAPPPGPTPTRAEQWEEAGSRVGEDSVTVAAELKRYGPPSWFGSDWPATISDAVRCYWSLNNSPHVPIDSPVIDSDPSVFAVTVALEKYLPPEAKADFVAGAVDAAADDVALHLTQPPEDDQEETLLRGWTARDLFGDGDVDDLCNRFTYTAEEAEALGERIYDYFLDFVGSASQGDDVEEGAHRPARGEPT